MIEISQHSTTKSFVIAAAGFLLVFFGFFSPVHAQIIATTTVTISLCGDLITTPPEECDGEGTGNGEYSTSIAGRNCTPSCTWGPYCGDSILQASQGEECDDGNNTPGDFCSAACTIEAVTSSGGGGGVFTGGSLSPPPPAQVTIQGKAYPNSDVNILKDGEVIGVVRSDAKADFFFTTSGVTPGTVTFGFWSEDQNGLRSVAFTTTFQVIRGAATTISGIFLPPTIELDKRSVKQGEVVNISGQSVPEVTVRTFINSEEEIVKEVETDEEGNWVLPFDTSPLEEDIHTVKALFEIQSAGALLQSGLSQSISFFVGDGDISDFLDPDLNRDGKVNLIDFSILLFHWGGSGGSSDPPADINRDGTVNLTDFSILVFNWTG